jgi:hypothetical protein
MTKEYYEGVIEGLTRYAWWKDGVQYVGTCGRTLQDAIVDVEKEREDDWNRQAESFDINKLYPTSLQSKQCEHCKGTGIHISMEAPLYDGRCTWCNGTGDKSRY